MITKPAPKGTPAAVRIRMHSVITPEGCWEWQGNRTAEGYGQIAVAGKTRFAHRIAYEIHIGPIPAGMHIDHLCQNPPCCNPQHLEPVTPRENLMRADTPAARNAAKTHCLRDHEFTPENTRLYRGRRHCRACSRRYMRALRLKVTRHDHTHAE